MTSDLGKELTCCRLCAPRFALTATAHVPRPVVWFRPSARLLICGQAPGAKVHAIGQPFRDASGDRLRSWTGLTEAQFYDLDRVAIVPMAFCFPGYDTKGSDLPPPPICAATWRRRVLAELGKIRLTLLVGGAAIRWHLGPGPVGEWVRDWRNVLQTRQMVPLPHPSWRNTGWLRQNPWFTDEILPVLRAEVARVMEDTE